MAKGIYEGKDGYFKEKIIRGGSDEGQMMEVQLTPFIITPRELIKCEDSLEYNSDITYKNREYKDVGMTAKDFASVKDFEIAISGKISPAVWFDGNKKDLTDIKKYIAEKEIREIEGVKCSGFHRINDTWHYVTGEGVLQPDNTLCDDIKLMSAFKEIDNPEVLTKDGLSHEDMQKLSTNLFDFNSIGITSTFMGYLSSLFLKERLFTDNKIKFPNMAIIGNSGSGKSETMESIGMPILNMASNKQSSANQLTKFVGMKNASSTNTVPFVINEYKSHKLNDNIIHTIDNLGNNCYDRYTAQRGQASLKTNVYQANSAVILIGESYAADQSAIERMIRLYLSKGESLKKFEGFKKLKGQHKLLNKLGKDLLLTALNITDAEILELIETNRTIVNDTEIETTRSIDNLIVILLGLDLLNMAMENNISDRLTELKKAVLNRYHDDTLDGNNSSKSALGEVFELINQLAIEGKISRGVHYKELASNGEVAIDIKTVFNILQETSRSRGEQLPLTQKGFMSLVSREEFYSNYKPVKLKKLDDHTKDASRKVCVFKLQELLKLNLDIAMLTDVDAESVFEEKEEPVRSNVVTLKQGCM